MYGYDAVGSFEKKKITCNGAATMMMTPVFDNQVRGLQAAELEGQMTSGPASLGRRRAHPQFRGSPLARLSEKCSKLLGALADSWHESRVVDQVDWLQSWDGEGKPNLTLEEAVDLVKDAFTSAAEREITVGDTLEIFKVTKEGITVEEFELRKD